MIGNIGVMGAALTGGWLGGEGDGGEIHGPENHSGSVEIQTPGSHNAAGFGAVEGEVAERLGNAEARDAGEAAGASHIVQAGAGVEVVATAGASANRRAVAMAAVGKNVTAETDHQLLRAHREPPQGQSFRVGPEVKGFRGKERENGTKVTRISRIGEKEIAARLLLKWRFIVRKPVERRKAAIH